MTDTTESTPVASGTMPKKGGPKQKPIFVVKIKCLPYGFFEKQLWEYFTQFGTVVRARVARSTKTGNHKGWAYVGFDNKDVAEVAAETMNGYLMFEKRLLCHVMEKPPKCMLSGPRYVAPPHMKGSAKKTALKMNAKKTEEKEDMLKKKRSESLGKLAQKLIDMGVEYDLSAIPSLTTQKQSKDDNKEKEVELVAEKKSAKPKAKTPKKKQQLLEP